MGPGTQSARESGGGGGGVETETRRKARLSCAISLRRRPDGRLQIYKLLNFFGPNSPFPYSPPGCAERRG
ncbi:unnamed protein product [Caenorhabditis auriculariae]|uniref:Uncharacterized protein n=1 Tax=Caenorhabditis auriculariae TaxID=2777116 RepID=A0A8S1GP27_9PELO|nr:unnamed protein product [Caenorhabditis auriculariae]